MARFIDLTGERFDRLFVARLDHISKFGQAHWQCTCACNNTCIVAAHNLRSGRTRSCGCIPRGRKPKKITA